MSESSTDDISLSGQTDTTTDASAASGSSSEANDQGASSMLEAVQAAIKPEEQEDAEASPTPENPESKEAGSEPEKSGEKPNPDELSEEEKKSLKPKVAKQIERLLGDRRTLRSEVDGLKSKAATADEMQAFIDRAGLTNQDFSNGLEIMSLLKNSPAKAYEKLQPIMSELSKLVGEGPLPGDLAEKVRLGYINEEDARALAKANSRLQLNEQSERERAERQEAEQEEQARTALVKDVSLAASDWERSIATKDPDWHLKSARVHELMKLSVYEKGYPKSSDEIRDRLKDVHEQVGKELRRLNPKPRAITPVNGGSSPPRSVAEPKNMLEAIQGALRGEAA